MTNKLELTEQQTTKTTKAIAATVAALVILAFMSILVRVSESDTSPNTTVFSFSWIGTLLLLFWNGLSILNRRGQGFVDDKSEKFSCTPLKILLLLALGLSTTGISMFWTWSLTKTSVANSDLLHAGGTPIFTTLGGWIFLSQKFDRSFIIGVGIALAGAIGIGLEDISVGVDKLEGDGLALLSSLCWSVSLLIREKLRTQFSATTVTFWCLALSTLFVLPILFVTGDELFPHSWSSWLSLIFIGLGEVLNMILTAYSLKWLSSGLVSTILLLCPVLAGILAWTFFCETLSPLNLLGFVVILLGIYLVISGEGGVKTTTD